MTEHGYRITTALVWLLAVLMGLVLWVIVNPNINVPGLSVTVCSMKGGYWIDTPFTDRPGCYRQEDGEVSP